MSRDRLAEVLEHWEPVIGLEIHTELTASRTKMFCACQVAFGGEPNTRTCPVCLGLPGALPVPNRHAVEMTLLAGLAVNCEIARWSQFHRKQYFYPDMPKDYQISQYDLPFCGRGWIDVDIDGDNVAQRVDRTGETGYTTRIGITRIHLEEDTGKMVHVGGAEGRLGGATSSLVDFNRAGTPLMELVTEPDIRTPEEARRFAQKLRLVFVALGVSDCNMEEGSMRVDANVSVRARGESEYGTKSEVKNMNSFKSLHDALAYEIVRQADELERGGRVVQETRHWDAGAKRTSALRSKEEAHDYRYFPEPDMVPFTFTDEFIEELRGRLPELPDARRDRFMATWHISKTDASQLVEDPEIAEAFEEALPQADARAAVPIANYFNNQVAAYLKSTGRSFSQSALTSGGIAELADLVFIEGTVSATLGNQIFSVMAETGVSPRAIVEEQGLKQVSDSGAIEAVVDAVLAANPDKVEAYRGGKTGLMGFFVGQVMREMGGQANPGMVNEVLGRRLGG